MNPLVLSFDPSGTGSCLYSELIDLSEIGPLEVQRASTLNFNNASQRWEARNQQGNIVFSSRFRAICLAWEQQHFQ